MAISSGRRFGRLYSVCGVLFLLLTGSLHASQTTITIGGSEQYALPATWDGGSLSLTVNGHTETVGYGQFSTVQSVASGLAAKFSLDCTSPVVALASGATITFTTRHPDEGFEQISASAVWNTAAFTRASFGIPQSAATTTATLTPSLMLACTPDPVPVGGSADCTAHLFQGVTGTVSFSLDGQASWSTATVDGSGWAPASALTGLQPGSHTLTASYSGDNTYNATTQTLAMQVDSGALASASIYSYSITSYDPDSNILGYTDQVNGSWSSIQYDNLNRLTGATATPVSGMAQNWCWSYDLFGNRTLEATSAGSVACTNSGTGNQTVPTANNQIAGLVYDAAGNVTFDGINSYAYDGDGRMCAMATHPPSGGTIAFQYIYDADGNRVAKGTIQLISVNGVQTLSCDTTQNSFTPTSSYILGQNDEVVTEMTVVGGQSVWAHTNAWAGGMLLATYDPQGLHFHLTDWLGSRRVQTNAFGQVEETCVNSPFGNGLTCSFPASAPTTADDATEHHFTGKERDTESGLDYFGARYYASSMGRFMSPDPGWFIAGDITDPQSLNQYAYVDNNPLVYTDPDGMHFECTSSTIHYTDDQGNDQSSTSSNCKWVDDPSDLTAGLINFPKIQPQTGPKFTTPSRTQPRSCINPTGPQRAARAVYGYAAKKLGKTVGAGLGASGGVGSGIGLGGSASAQLVASPDGTSGLAVTLPAMPATLMSSGPQGSLGGGIIGGPQVSISNAQTIQDLSGAFYGVGFAAGSGEAGGLDFSGGYNASGQFIGQLNGTVGYGAGGFGAAGQKTNTTVTPFCK